MIAVSAEASWVKKKMKSVSDSESRVEGIDSHYTHEAQQFSLQEGTLEG
jgi:hypothetical protein